MSRIEEILATYPATPGLEPARLAEAVGALYECAGVCLACADACSGETDPAMVAKCLKCIRMDLDCADLCTATARIVTRQTGYDAPTTFAAIEAARAALTACEAACDEMSDMAHCAICADVCRTTNEVLGELVAAMTTSAAAPYPSEPPSATTPAGAELAGR